nr:RNA-directed DNA polymerase, eukaryota [Tanacetum cinerariifolium]
MIVYVKKHLVQVSYLQRFPQRWQWVRWCGGCENRAAVAAVVLGVFGDDDDDIDGGSVSGLKINFHKSKLLGVGVSPSEVSSFAALTGCNPLITPFTYLELPIDCNMARIKS